MPGLNGKDYSSEKSWKKYDNDENKGTTLAVLVGGSLKEKAFIIIEM